MCGTGHNTRRNRTDIIPLVLRGVIATLGPTTALTYVAHHVRTTVAAGARAIAHTQGHDPARRTHSCVRAHTHAIVCNITNSNCIRHITGMPKSRDATSVVAHATATTVARAGRGCATIVVAVAVGGPPP